MLLIVIEEHGVLQTKILSLKQLGQHMKYWRSFTVDQKATPALTIAIASDERGLRTALGNREDHIALRQLLPEKKGDK